MSQAADDQQSQHEAEPADAEETAASTEPPFVADGAISSGRPEGSVPGQPDAQDADRGSGTGGGNPLAGVLIDPEDAEHAVPGDEGPEHPGRR